ncbi:MAG: DNA replication/repair protein RecF [Candidatus Competibacteraceae bacterium]|jgi:DNA replication and repair protein RecF|nr:DNA replication/repair protein RecF [Candidatus Competibacteraceae bacterium]
MIVSSLEIDNFRNFDHLVLQFTPRLNLISGENASGKTSLLEALYFLGRARSFRTRRAQELIRTEQHAFRIVATVEASDGRRIPVGIQRSSREFVARIDGEPVRSLAQLALQIPALLLNPNSHRLLEDGPRQRRRFMDWGLFHGDSAFWSAWKRYGVALRSRNAALRSHATDRVMNAWDEEWVSAAEVLDQLRKGFCETLKVALKPLIEEILGKVALKLEYRPGWPQNRKQSLAQIIRHQREQDRRYGHTGIGPHRADFYIALADRPVAEYLSRGQQKLLVIALILAQAQLYRSHHHTPCLLLIDDLPAELDSNHRARVMSCLAGIEAQLFITAIEPGALDTSAWLDPSIFRLEQGSFT